MDHRAERHAWLTTLATGIGGLLLVVSVTQPLARDGIGSATSLHELFDLLLSGTLRLGIPRWLGFFGYLPALGGVLVMLAEALMGRARTIVRSIGLGCAAGSVAVLSLAGPWNQVGRLGTGLLLGIAGTLVVTASWSAAPITRRLTGSSSDEAGGTIPPPNADHLTSRADAPESRPDSRSGSTHVLSTVPH